MLNQNSILNNLFLVKCKIHDDKGINFRYFIKYWTYFNIIIRISSNFSLLCDMCGFSIFNKIYNDILIESKIVCMVIIRRTSASFARNFFKITIFFDYLTCRYETFYSLGEFWYLTSKISICIFFNLYRSVKKQALRGVPLTSNLNIVFPRILIRWEDQWNMAVIGESLCGNESIHSLFDIR